MPIQADPDGTLDIENATLRSRGIVALTNLVAGNDVVRGSGAPTLEVYGDPGPRLELVSNTAATDGTATFTRLESNYGVFSIQSGTDASDNGPITFGGFANERMRIDADGNVGVGVAIPLRTLEVQGNGQTVNGGVIHARISDPGSAPYESNAFSMNMGSYSHSIRMNLNTLSLNAYGDVGRYGNMKFVVGDGSGSGSGQLDAMTILSGGNVGIGTTNPEYPLDINKSAGDIEIRIEPGSDAQGNESGIRFGATFETTVDNGPRRAADLRVGYNGGAWGTEYMSFRVGTGGQNDVHALTTERMRIAGNGNVGIGTNDPKSSLHINSTGAMITPIGTTAQRPTTALNGMFRLNQTENAMEYYNGNWIPLAPRSGLPIVTNGLAVLLDASDFTSYPISGSTWFDTSGNGRNGTLRGSVSWVDSGQASYFDFSGLDPDYIDQTSGSSLVYKDICIVFNVDAMSSSFGYLVSRSTTSDTSLRVGVNNIANPGNNGDWSDGTPGAITYYVNGVADTDNVPINNGEWYILGGENTNDGLLSSPWYYHLGTGFIQGDRNLNGKIAFVALYDRVLTSTEQLQNYNALKSRFGV